MANHSTTTPQPQIRMYTSLHPHPSTHPSTHSLFTRADDLTDLPPSYEMATATQPSIATSHAKTNLDCICPVIYFVLLTWFVIGLGLIFFLTRQTIFAMTLVVSGHLFSSWWCGREDEETDDMHFKALGELVKEVVMFSLVGCALASM